MWCWLSSTVGSVVVVLSEMNRAVAVDSGVIGVVGLGVLLSAIDAVSPKVNR